MSGNITHIYQFHFQSNRAKFGGWRFVSNHLSAQFIKHPQRLRSLAEPMGMTQGQSAGQKPSFCICPLYTRLNFSIADDSRLLIFSSVSKEGRFPHWGLSLSHRRVQIRRVDSRTLSRCVQYEPCQGYHQHILTQLSTGPPFIRCFHSPSPQKCTLFAAKTEKRRLKQEGFLCNIQAPTSVNKA